jgi:5-methylcytosine-specific restriction endonuclease McrA
MPKGIYNHYKIKGENNPSKRIEVKEKISNALKNKPKSEKHRENMSKSNKGKHSSIRTEFKKGHKPLFTEERNKKISMTRKKLFNEGKLILKCHQSENWINAMHLKKGKKMPYEFGRKISKTREERIATGKIKFLNGEKHPMWAGGITPIHNKIRNLPQYRRWVFSIFKKDNFICQNCGYQGKEITAHHLKRFSKIIREFNIKSEEEAINCTELWNTQNGVTLCWDCHFKIHFTKNAICEQKMRINAARPELMLSSN